jgi:hypothetical protein
LEVVLASARKVFEATPKIFEPVADHFDVDIKERLYNEKYTGGLYYA